MVLGIAVVNYRTAESVRRLVPTLVTFTGRGTLLLTVVDNSSELEEIEAIVQDGRRSISAQGGELDVSVIASVENLGFARGNNVAAQSLLERGADYLWFLNPDIEILNGQLEDVLASIEAATSPLLTTKTVEGSAEWSGLQTVSLLSSQTRKAAESGVARGSEWRKLLIPAGHSLIVRSVLWVQLDGFSPDHFLYYEEADLAFRARKLGVRPQSIQAVTVLHAGAASTNETVSAQVDRSRVVASKLTYEEASRSALIFFRNNLPLRAPLVTVMRLGYALFVGRRFGASRGQAIARGILRGWKTTLQARQGKDPEHV